MGKRDDYKKAEDDLRKETGITDEDLKVFTRKGQAELFISKNPIFYDRSGLWWFWNKTEFKWKIVDEVDVLNMIGEVLNIDTIETKVRTEIINSLKQEGRKHIPEPIKLTWIQFQDEIIDITTGERFQATEKYFVTNPISYKLSQDTNTLVMDRIFEEWVGKDHVQTLYEIIAYCLIPDYPISRIFCLIGSGMNGKSCFINLLKKFIGTDNAASTELDTLLTSRFEITKLHKKLLCIMGETDFKEISRTSVLKRLTGRDLIGFEYKNKNPFDDYNYAKIVIATNNLPATDDKSIGFYRRWLIIDFPNQFSESKDILNDIPEEEYNNLALKSFILLNDLLKVRQFTNEGNIEERMRKFEEKSNPFDKFIKENCDLDDLDGYIFSFEFEKKFNNWCKDNKFRDFSDEIISKKMKSMNLTRGRKLSDWLINGQSKQLRCWFGIKWKE